MHCLPRLMHCLPRLMEGLPFDAVPSARSVRLYELGDVEAAEVPGRRRPVDLDLGDASHARPFLSGSFELFQVPPATLRDELDDAVVSIGHPARQPKRLCTPDQKEPKADSLDVALDDAM